MRPIMKRLEEDQLSYISGNYERKLQWTELSGLPICQV